MLKALGYAGFGSDKLDDWRTFGTSLLGFQAVERRANQHCIMDRRADFDPLFGAEAAGQPQHFGTIGLHREIA